MNITILGGTGRVTGSKFFVRIDGLTRLNTWSTANGSICWTPPFKARITGYGGTLRRYEIGSDL